jgi:aerobic carbon-monoxide dehydrogenase large subunit
MARDGVGPMLCLWPIVSADGAPMKEPPRFALARGRVRHVGEAVAIVVAETRDQALDAAELVAVDYEALPAVTESNAALATGAPLLHDGASGNFSFLWARGDAAAVEQGFAAATHVVEIDLVNNRLVGAALEPRAVIAIGGGDGLTLYSSTQVPHHIRKLVAEQLGMSESALRVIAPDVGGGFGYKGKNYPEEAILAWAARRLRRTLKWVATRSESFVADYQGRDHRTHAALALDAEGRFLALRVRTLANLGAYVSTFGAAIPSAIYTALLAGVYRTPAVRVECTGVFTNTVPTDAYRGAGRPEACYVLERLADQAASALGIDRAELRRRNLVPATAMPYKTPIGPTYDCGDFPKVFERALTLADYDGLAARKSRAPPGILRGLGIACYVESSGVAPSRFAGALGARAGFFEAATVRMQADGAVQAMLGTHSHGQGHATSFAQILASRLGVPVARVEIVEGDTAIVPHGTGTFGSRSIAVGGCALDRAADKIVAKGKRIAAHLLEAAESDIAFHDGIFAIAGTDRSISLTEVAREAYTAHHLPLETIEPGLQETAFYDPPSFAFSNGAHLCEVEVDRATGAVKIVGYWAVDDIGTVINPMIVEGQLHGGAAQGIGQALLESCVYDRDTGQILSGSFLDYAMPRAGDLPLFVTEFDESQPCTHNPLGAKGCGEAGAVAAPAAVVSAVLDALAPLGVADVAMPLTPETVWRAIIEAT